MTSVKRKMSISPGIIASDLIQIDSYIIKSKFFRVVKRISFPPSIGENQRNPKAYSPMITLLGFSN